MGANVSDILRNHDPADPVDARAVAEAMLQLTGRAIIDGDFESFARCLHYPQRIGSFEGEQILRSQDDARRVYDGVRQTMDALGVTDMTREVVACDYKDATTIQTTHVSYLLAGDRLVQRPYPTHSLLAYRDGHWGIIESHYAVADNTMHGRVLAGTTESEEEHKQ